MPTYEYVCRTCGHRFDHFQSITSAALTHCPVEECAMTNEEEKGKGEVTRKVSGGAGLVFKGEGFYLTDYVRKSGGESGEGGSSGSSGNPSSTKGKSGESKSESASGTKGESKNESKSSSSQGSGDSSTTSSGSSTSKGSTGSSSSGGDTSS